MTHPTGTITFLFTDIEGSTKLWDQHPDAMRAALARHDEIVRDSVAKHNGYVFKTMGDAFCIAFSNAPDGVRAGLAAQLAIQAAEWSETGQIRVRMALHTGEAEERDGDYFGPALNRTARLLSLGYGGQTLSSQTTCELTCDRLPNGAFFNDLGVHRLKDLSVPEQVFQLLHRDLPHDFPSLKSLDNPIFPNNLPRQLTSFIGREKEIAEIEALLHKTRLLTLTGSGGTGKTRLSVQVAADVLEQHADGVWLVELAPISDPDLVPQAVAQALSIREAPGEPITKTLLSALKNRQMLLVVDNCEHLLDASARLVDAILRGCPKVTIMASSREALGIAGERSYRVPSLSLPEADKTVAPESLFQYEAVRLFAERAEAVKADFCLTAGNASALASICRRLDGIPLAIELAASRIRSLTAEELEKRLDDRFRVLTGGSRTALPRQQTLRAMIDWSYDLLEESQKALLCRLSVFAGGWSLEAAEAVCGDEGGSGRVGEWETGREGEGERERGRDALRPRPYAIRPDDVLDLLTSLADKSLVTAEDCDGVTRYRLLETVRQYARDRLAESGEGGEFRNRHLDHFLALAEEAESQLNGPEQAQWLNRLEMEHDNLRAALEWGSRDGEAGRRGEGATANTQYPIPNTQYSVPNTEHQALRLAGSLCRFWYVRGYLTEGRERLACALARYPDRRDGARAKALNGAGLLANSQGDYAAARALHEESITIKRELADKLGIAGSLNNLGSVASNQGDYAAARAMHEECLTIWRELGNNRGIASTLNNLGNVARSQGDYSAAWALIQEALIFNRELGDRSWEAGNLSNLGSVAKDQGDYAAARALHEESLTIERELGDKRGIAASLNCLGLVSFDQGDYAAAREMHEESLTIRRELGDKQGIAGSLNNLGLVADAQGDCAAARLLYQEALALNRELGNRAWESINLGNLGNVTQHQGDFAAAHALHGESLAIRRELGDSRGIADSLETFAVLAAVQEAPRLAAVLWGTAERLREEIGAPLAPNEKSLNEKHFASARAAVGDVTFEAAGGEGRAMTMEEAIELALEGANA